MLAVQRRTRVYPVLLPHARPDEHPAPRRRPRRSAAVQAVLMATLLVVPAVCYVAQQAHVARTGYEILHLRHDVSTLQGENARLLAAAMTLRSLQRVERIATTDLGMRHPGVGQQTVLAIAPPPAVAAAPAASATRPFWARASAWLGWSEAEAREPAR